MAERKRHVQPRALHTPVMRAGHLRVGPSLVDDQLLRLELVLAVEPGTPARKDVAARLLGGMADLFLREIQCRMKKRDRAEMDTVPPVWPSRAFRSTRVVSPVASRIARVRSASASVT